MDKATFFMAGTAFGVFALLGFEVLCLLLLATGAWRSWAATVKAWLWR